ncbi:hypothetical protein CPB83DRAFT_902398 [Crepidotus variabilis]|uniref:Uncharacterized protein n=1 Tax=Crepidotus variabilis TaxID=179855 RepID=A0A9P6JW29_9AGAR|nr:hypothetical protein CPB83DRAFT_902398 [Crepidotus variabilis]
MSSSNSQKPGKRRRGVPIENASPGSSSPKKRHLSSGNMLISSNLTSSQPENAIAGPSNSRKTSNSSAQSSVTPSRRSSRVSLPTPKRKAMMPDENTTTDNESDKTPPPSISQGLKRKTSDRKVEKSSSTFLKSSDSQGNVLELSSDSDITLKRPSKRAKVKHKCSIPLPKEVIELSDDEVTPNITGLKPSPAKKPPRLTQTRNVATKPKQKKRDNAISRPLPEDIIEIPSTDDEAGVPPKTSLPSTSKLVSTTSKLKGKQSRTKAKPSPKTSTPSSAQTSRLVSFLHSPVFLPILPEPTTATLTTKPLSLPSPPAATEEFTATVLEPSFAMDVDSIVTDALEDPQNLLQFTLSSGPAEPGSRTSPFELDKDEDDSLSIPEALVSALATPRPESPAIDGDLEAMSRTDSFATLPPLSPSPDPVIRHLPAPIAVAPDALDPIMIDLDSPSPKSFYAADEVQIEIGTGQQELAQEQVEDPLKTPLAASEPLMIDLDSPCPEDFQEMVVAGPVTLTQEHIDEVLRRVLSKPLSESGLSSAPSPFRHNASGCPTFSFKMYTKSELYANDEEIRPPRVLWTDLIFGNAMKILNEKRVKVKKAEQDEERKRLERSETRKGKEKAKEIETALPNSPQSGDVHEVNIPEGHGKEAQDGQVATMVEALEYVAIAGEPSSNISMVEDQTVPILLDHQHKDIAGDTQESRIQQDLDVEMGVQKVFPVREDARTLVLKVLKLNALETYEQITGASQEINRLPFPSLVGFPTSNLIGGQIQGSPVPSTSIGAHLPIEDETELLAKSRHVAFVFSQITALQSALSVPDDTVQPTEQALYQPPSAPAPETDFEQLESLSISIPYEIAADRNESLSQMQIDHDGSTFDDTLIEEASVEAALELDELDECQSDILAGSDAQVSSPRDSIMGNLEHSKVQTAGPPSAVAAPEINPQLSTMPTTPAEEGSKIKSLPQDDSPITPPNVLRHSPDVDVSMLKLPVEQSQDPEIWVTTPQAGDSIPLLTTQPSSEDSYEEHIPHPIATAYSLIKNFVDRDIPANASNPLSTSRPGTQEPAAPLENLLSLVESERSASELKPAVSGSPTHCATILESTSPLPQSVTEGVNKPREVIDVHMESVEIPATHEHNIRARLSPSLLPTTQTSLLQSNPLRSPDLSMYYSSTSGSSDTTDDSVRLATPPLLESLPMNTNTKGLIYAFDVSVLDDPNLTLEKLRECGKHGFSHYDLEGDIDDYTFPDWS